MMWLAFVQTDVGQVKELGEVESNTAIDALSIAKSIAKERANVFGCDCVGVSRCDVGLPDDDVRNEILVSPIDGTVREKRQFGKRWRWRNKTSKAIVIEYLREMVETRGGGCSSVKVKMYGRRRKIAGLR